MPPSPPYDTVGAARVDPRRARRASAAPSRWRLLPRLVWLNFRETVKNVYFGVIALAGVLFCIATSTTAGSIFGTVTWPVTYQVLELVAGTFAIFMLVIITFYAGELMWRERETRLDQIHDALPIPTWLPFVGKLLALMLVPVVLQAVLMLCGLGIQTARAITTTSSGCTSSGCSDCSSSTTGWSACSRSSCIRWSTRSTSAT